MTAPPDAVIQKVQQWALFADEDLRLAEHGLALVEDCPHRLVAYHAQQCAEKYLKAFLVHAGVDFPFTHNVSVLLEFCSERSTWAETLEDAERLSRYAVTTRYPGEERVVSLKEAEEAIEIAGRVRQAVRADLIRMGVALGS